MELREKIAREIADCIAVDRSPIDVALATADAILAIPELQEALANRATAEFAYTRGYEDGQDCNTFSLPRTPQAQ